jgi:hypothetical protein
MEYLKSFINYWDDFNGTISLSTWINYRKDNGNPGLTGFPSGGNEKDPNWIAWMGETLVNLIWNFELTILGSASGPGGTSNDCFAITKNSTGSYLTNAIMKTKCNKASFFVCQIGIYLTNDKELLFFKALFAHFNF